MTCPLDVLVNRVSGHTRRDWGDTFVSHQSLLAILSRKLRSGVYLTNILVFGNVVNTVVSVLMYLLNRN